MEGDDHGEAYTAIAWGVGLSHEMVTMQGLRRSKTSKAICAEPLSEVPSPCRGLKATSRMKGTRRNLGDLLPGRAAFSRAGPHREGEEP